MERELPDASWLPNHERFSGLISLMQTGADIDLQEHLRLLRESMQPSDGKTAHKTDM